MPSGAGRRRYTSVRTEGMALIITGQRCFTGEQAHNGLALLVFHRSRDKERESTKESDMQDSKLGLKWMFYHGHLSGSSVFRG